MGEIVKINGQQGQVKIRNENVILLVAIVDGNVQIMTNKALIKRLEPGDASRTAHAVKKIIDEDFGIIIL